MIETQRLILYPLSYDQLRVLLGEKPRRLGDISLELLAEEDIPKRPIGIKLEKMSGLSIDEHIWCTYFLMVDKATRMAVGSLGYKGVPADGETEVGYGTAGACWGRGYMTEALTGLLGWTEETGRCRKVTANTHRDNTASQKVLEKCGFIKVGETGELFLFEKELG